MVESIRAEVGATARETGRRQLAPAVLAALGRVPRHEFVRERDEQVVR